jgi:hypothetical protein
MFQRMVVVAHEFGRHRRGPHPLFRRRAHQCRRLVGIVLATQFGIWLADPIVG